MASTVVFDMADPGIKSTVEGWADNTEYEVTMKVRTGSGAQRNVAEVVEMESDETASETPEETPEEEEGPAAPGEDQMPMKGVTMEDGRVVEKGVGAKKPKMPAIPYK